MLLGGEARDSNHGDGVPVLEPLEPAGPGAQSRLRAQGVHSHEGEEHGRSQKCNTGLPSDGQQRGMCLRLHKTHG